MIESSLIQNGEIMPCGAPFRYRLA